MAIRNILVRLAGHDPKFFIEYGRGDHQAIIHTGWTVLPPLIITFLNWAAAGIVLSAGAGWAAAVLAGLLFGAIGFFVVFVFDRAALYHMDTQVGSVRSKFALVAIRVLIILLISSLTTQAIVPVLMRSELAQEALRVREQTEEQRIQRLTARYDVPGHQAAADQADTAVEGAKHALAIVPQPIQKRLDAAQQCWAGHNRRRQQLRLQGLSDSAVRQSLSQTHGRCSIASSSAQRALEAHRQKLREALVVAEERAKGTGTARTEAETNLKKKLAEAAEIEQLAIVPQSSIVLESLLKTNSGARQKWWIIYLGILFIEIMALFLKLMAGASELGTRIATDRLIAAERYTRRRNAAAQEGRLEETLRETMTAAMLTAMSSQDVQNFAAQLFASKIEALVPIEVFRALMREIESGEVDVQAAIQRHPDYARIIIEAWRKTVEEVVERLRPKQAYARRAAA